MAGEQVRDRIEVARTDVARLEQRFRQLSPEQLTQPSACDRWQVADVVAHLAFVALFQGRMISNGLAGDSSPPEAVLRQGPDAPPAAERIAQGALTLRERLGDQLIDTFHQRYQELFQILDPMEPADYAKPCWHPRGDTSVADFVNLVVTELALHGWDASSPVDRSYHVNSASLSAGLDLAPGLLLRALQGEPAVAGPVRYRFELSDGGSVPDLVADQAGIRLEDGSEQPATAMLRCDSEAYLLMTYGRLAMEAAKSSGRLSVVGDQAVAEELGGRLTGV